MQTFKEYVAEQKEKIKEDIKKFPWRTPKLVILNVGDDPASQVYIKGKLKDCEEVGIKAEMIHFNSLVSEEEFLEEINRLNEDKSVDGFIVQLPVPEQLHKEKIIEAIKPEKDVDGFSKKTLVNPATPQGILDYLVAQNVEFTDKNVVVIGRSEIVGKPMARLLLEQNCNVTIVHSKTSEEHKREYLKNADIIISAVGKRHVIDKTYELKSTAILIDVGMNRNEEGKLCGDLDYADLVNKVQFISPVPGSVGLTTRLALITNLLKLYYLKFPLCKNN